jgi:hypothetical protein
LLFSVKDLAHSKTGKEASKKIVSLKPIEILSIIEGEDTPRQTTCNF